MRTLQNYRDYVRSYLDVDVLDIPDALVDAWVAEGQTFVLRSMPVWEHLHTTAPFTTVNGTRDYSVNLENIESIQGPQWMLMPLGIVAGDSIYTPNVTDSGDVYYWAVTGKTTANVSTVRLYPTPTAAAVMTPRGWRQPVIPLAAADQPDLPQDFQHILDLFVLVRGCHQQNDFFQAQMLNQTFQEEWHALLTHYTQAPRRKVILNRRRRLNSKLHDLRFPFEPAPPS